MTEREQDLERICHSAFERPLAERAAFLAACEGDDDLRQEAESLLARASAAASFLEIPAVASLGCALGADRTALSDGDHVGPYMIVAHLGGGGMGEVY